MDHIGIDVHKRESQICILAEGGELIEERIRTEPERFAAVLGQRPRARILLEASTDSEWVARCLEGLGHEVIVGDPNFAPMYATRTRKVKTDRRDARALRDACLLGAYRPAHRLSDPQRHVRGRLTVRDSVVRTRTRYISLIRALLRQQATACPPAVPRPLCSGSPPCRCCAHGSCGSCAGRPIRGGGYVTSLRPPTGPPASRPRHTPFMLPMLAGIALHRVSGARGKPWPAAPA